MSFDDELVKYNEETICSDIDQAVFSKKKEIPFFSEVEIILNRKGYRHLHLDIMRRMRQPTGNSIDQDSTIYYVPFVGATSIKVENIQDDHFIIRKI